MHTYTFRRLYFISPFIAERMIEVRNIKKTFDGKTIIEDVSAVMQTGQCNLIIGSSGSGKTVLMKCMVGLFVPDGGDVI